MRAAEYLKVKDAEVAKKFKELGVEEALAKHEGLNSDIVLNWPMAALKRWMILPVLPPMSSSK